MSGRDRSTIPQHEIDSAQALVELTAIAADADAQMAVQSEPVTSHHEYALAFANQPGQLSRVDWKVVAHENHPASRRRLVCQAAVPAYHPLINPPQVPSQDVTAACQKLFTALRLQNAGGDELIDRPSADGGVVLATQGLVDHGRGRYEPAGTQTGMGERL